MTTAPTTATVGGHARAALRCPAFPQAWLVAALVATSRLGAQTTTSASQKPPEPPAAEAKAPATAGTQKPAADKPAADAKKPNDLGDVLPTQTFDVTTGQVSSVMPFNEPFVVTIAGLPTTVQAVTIRMQDAETFGGTPPTCAEPAGWSVQRQWTTPASGTPGAQARVVVPPLRANRFYHICVLSVSKPEQKDAERFAVVVRDTLDQLLRTFVASGVKSLGADEARQMQRLLLAAATSATAGYEVRVAKGSVFDTLPSTDPERRVQSVMSVARLLDLTRNRNQAATNFERLRAGAATSLDALAAAAARADRAAIARLGAEGGRVAQLLAAAAEPTELSGRHLVVAGGEMVMGGPQPLTPVLPDPMQIWDARQLDTPLENLRRTHDSLATLRLTLAEAAQSPRFTKHARALSVLARLAETAAAEIRGAASGATALQRRIGEREAGITSAVGALAPRYQSSVDLHGSSIGDLVTRSRSRVSVEAGVASTPRVGRAAAYMGLNFYVAPVNKKMPLGLSKWREGQRLQYLAQRTSLSLGVSLNTMTSNGREDLIGSNSLLLGVGYRVWDAFRVSAMVVPFRAKHPNPLLDRSHLTGEFAIAASVDNDIRSVLGDVYSLLLPGR